MTKTMHIGEFKERFSEVVEMLKKGIVIKVIKGKSGELVGFFGKEPVTSNESIRKIGFFADAKLSINANDLKWSDDELKDLGL